VFRTGGVQGGVCFGEKSMGGEGIFVGRGRVKLEQSPPSLHFCFAGVLWISETLLLNSVTINFSNVIHK
jgi:hypothetical protein